MALAVPRIDVSRLISGGCLVVIHYCDNQIRLQVLDKIHLTRQRSGERGLIKEIFASLEATLVIFASHSQDYLFDNSSCNKNRTQKV
jgi:hypothetical protein